MKDLLKYVGRGILEASIVSVMLLIPMSLAATHHFVLTIIIFIIEMGILSGVEAYLRNN